MLPLHIANKLAPYLRYESDQYSYLQHRPILSTLQLGLSWTLPRLNGNSIPLQATQEVFIVIISNLPLRELATASLVSRTWNNITLPHLYHDISLRLSCHLERFEGRLVRDGDSKRSARFYTGNLTLETPHRNSAIQTLGEQPITERDLHRIDSIVSRLTRLHHFSWDLPFFPKDSSILENLQCDPNLNSVTWLIKQGERDLGYNVDQYYSLFNFQNLTQFTLSLDYTLLRIETPNPFNQVPDFLKSCPYLESFTIFLRMIFDREVVVSIRALAAALNNIVFPSLHTFRIHGPVDPDWYGFFNQPNSHPLRTSFVRHPGFRTVGIGCVDGPPYPQPADSEHLAQLFPSLIHIEATPFICGPILSSRLSNQLQRLVVLYNDREIYEPDLGLVSQAIAPLPKLRQLVIHGDSSNQYCDISVDLLNRILDAMPALEELALHTWLSELDKGRLFDVLERAPGLRILGIDNRELSAVQLRLGASNFLECIPTFLMVCPRLERLNLITAYDTTESWNINRGSGGDPVVTRAIPCSWPEIAGDE